ncbi:MAG: hypothetical protein LBN96_07255 [Desulfovibrio sp.]|nr:hypothetical protein [Desulfovibrio sp.]
MAFFTIFVLTVPFGVLLQYLAKKKGYGWPMLLWAWVPLINVSIGFLIFAILPDKSLHEKIDRLLSGGAQN